MANRKVDMTGQRYGRLTVTSFSHTNHVAHWRCTCDCGNETVVSRGNLVKGQVQSCGCYREDHRAENGAKCARHGQRSNKAKGTGRSGTYTTWEAMNMRCNNPNYEWYYMYGGRGIKVCERWRKFENFLEDMGERPEGRTLDRIDGNLGYYKANCRWATPQEQTDNTAPKGSRK